MDKDYLSKKQQEFTDANNKEGFYVLAAAQIAGISDVKSDQFLLPELEPARLVEVLAAILDEVPEKTMKILTNGKLTPEEMREIRLECRNDCIISTMSEEISRCFVEIEKLGGIAEASDQLKKTGKTITDISKTVTAIQKDLMQKQSEDAPAKDKPKAESQSKEPVKTVTGPLTNIKKKEADKVDEDMKLPPKTDMRTIVGNANVDLEFGQVRPVDQRIISYNKAVYGEKLVDEKERAAEVKKILKHNPSDEQIEALTNAIKEGVSAEFLKFYADKKASPSKLAGITKLYKAMFDPRTSLKATAQA